MTENTTINIKEYILMFKKKINNIFNNDYKFNMWIWN